MNRKRKMLIAIILVAITLLNCVMPVLQVGAATDSKITFESNLYAAVRDELIRQDIKAAYIDEQRTIIIGADEIAQVTELALSNKELTDLTGLEVFKNLKILDLSSNELTKDSNLAVLNSFTLSTLDLSSNAIEDVSMITNLESIPNLNLHNQRFNIVNIVDLDTSVTSDQITEVVYSLPQILTRESYLKTEWLQEENSEYWGPYINWRGFDHQNIKVVVGEKYSDGYYEPLKGMVTLRIRVSDSTSSLYNSEIYMFFVVVDSQERGIHIPDTNMYKAVKEQLTKGQTVNPDLITYRNNSTSNLYERYYDEPQVLVIAIDDLVNRIASLDLSDKRIKKIDGIEKFVGLETNLDLSGNYIKSIDKLLELQENQEIEEAKLRERVNAQLALVADTVSKITSLENALKGQNEIKNALLKKQAEIEANLRKLQSELETLKEEKETLEQNQVDLTSDIEALEAEKAILVAELEELNTALNNENAALNALKDEKNALEKELADLKDSLVQAESGNDGIKAEIAAKENEIKSLETAITNKIADIANKQAEIDAKMEELVVKEEEINSKSTTIAIYDTQLSDVNMKIIEKEAEYAELTAQLNSTAFDSMVKTDAQIATSIDELMERAKEIIDPQLVILTKTTYGTYFSNIPVTITDENGNVFGEYLSNEYGQVLITEIPTGTYTIRGSVAMTNDLGIGVVQTLVVNEGLDYVVPLEFETMGSALIQFQKENGDVVDENTTILLKNTEGIVVEEKTTDAEGIISLPLINEGDYTVEFTIDGATITGTTRIYPYQFVRYGYIVNSQNYLSTLIEEKDDTRLPISGTEKTIQDIPDEDAAIMLENLRAGLEAVMSNVYGPINQKMNEVASLVTRTDLTEEMLDAKLAELTTVIEESRTALGQGEYGPATTSEEITTILNEYLGNVDRDLDAKLNAFNDLRALVLELNAQFIENMPTELEGLLAERERLQAEIDRLSVEIEGTEDTAGLADQKAALEEEVANLVAERDALTAEKEQLEVDLEQARQDLIDLNEELATSEATQLMESLKLQISDKEKEIAIKEAEIEEQDRKIVAAQERVTAKLAEIEAKQAEISAKQTEMEEAKKAIEEKETEIQAKIAEIAKVVEQLNSQRESIVEVELKIAEIQAQLDELYIILFNRMARLYEIYNRVDKLASFATAELKTIKTEEFLNLTHDKAKAMFEAQVEKIANLEENLTSFERNYLLNEYDIPTVITALVDKTFVDAEGNTYTEKVLETKAIENPIGTYFKNMASATEEWNLSDFKYWLSNFRLDDTYFSMAGYCYLVRLFDDVTACQAQKYVDIEIEKNEFDGEDTSYLREAKNTYSTVIREYNYSCSGVANEDMLFDYAVRMVNARADVNTYVYLPRLKALNVSENLIENIDIISQLTELVMFEAYDNEIVDISTVDWASMTKLRYLDLGFNGISNIEPLEVLENIEFLGLADNLISGKFDFDISKFEKLFYLDVSGNRIDDIQNLINYLAFEARAAGFDGDIARFLRNGYMYIAFERQQLEMTIENKFEVNEIRKEQLPKIFAQIEEIDYEATSFGIDSVKGNVTNDGKYVSLDTTREGNRQAIVTITDNIDSDYYSFGQGTYCVIDYTVGNIEPVNVTITPEVCEVITGKTQQFVAEVTGEYVTYQGVAWEVIGATSEETTISEEGLLTVGKDETAETLTVKATSMYDENVVAEATVTVVQKHVTSITVTPQEATIYRGESKTFTAVVEGENLDAEDKAVEWAVIVETDNVDEEGNPIVAAGTSVSVDGNNLTVTVGENEEITKFVVGAISVLDNEKVAAAVLTVEDRKVTEVLVAPEEITLSKGETQQFRADVNGINLRDEDKEVRFTVIGNTSDKTTVTEEGMLTVGTDERSTRIRVRATSVYDNTVYGEAIVTVNASQVTTNNSNLGYTVSEDYLLGVATKTPVDTFKTKLTEEYNVIVKKAGTIVTTGYIETGMFVEVQDANGNTVRDENGHLLVYEIVVKGDVNGDGYADSLDSSLIKAVRNEVVTLTDVQKKAADIDNNREIDLLDSKLLLYHRAEVRGYCLDYTI